MAQTDGQSEGQTTFAALLNAPPRILYGGEDITM